VPHHNHTPYTGGPPPFTTKKKLKMSDQCHGGPPILAVPIELLACILTFAARDAKLAIFTLWNVCNDFRHCMQNYVHIGELHIGYFLEVAWRNILLRHPSGETAACVADIAELLPQLPGRLPPNAVHCLNIAAENDFPAHWNIQGLHPNLVLPFIERFPTLTRVNAEETALQETAVARIVSVTHLQELDLSCTGRGSPGVTNHTMALLGNKASVTVLSLAHANCVTDLSPLQQLNLTTFSIQESENLDTDMLHTFLVNQHTLNHLDLTRCELDDMDTVIRAVAQLTNLTFLGLDGLHLTPDHAIQLNNLINLKELDLAGTWGFEGGLHNLQLHKLVTINLSELDQMTLEQLGGFTATHRAALRDLNIVWASFELLDDHAAMAMVSGHANNRFEVLFSIRLQGEAKFRAGTTLYDLI